MTTKKKPIRLPRVMSELITIALRDLRKVERSPRYLVNMGMYHGRLWGDMRCHVCFAGSVMAKSLRAVHGAGLYPEHFPRNESQLYALDCLRTGEVASAAEALNVRRAAARGGSLDRQVPRYETSRKRWRAAMRKLARDLKAVGL
jgi:hypothetical protein